MKLPNFRIFLVFVGILIVGCSMNKTVVVEDNQEGIPPDKIYIEPPLELHNAKLETVIKKIFDKVKQPYWVRGVLRGRLDIKLERKMTFEEFIEKFARHGYGVVIGFGLARYKYEVHPPPDLQRGILYKVKYINPQELIQILKLFLNYDGKIELIPPSTLKVEDYDTYGDVSDVLGAFDVLDNNKDKALRWNELGKLFEYHGSVTKAKKAYEEGLELYPDSKELLESLKKVEKEIDSIARKEEGLYILWTDYYSE